MNCMEHDILSKEVLSINFLITDSYSFVQMRKVMTIASNDNFQLKKARAWQGDINYSVLEFSLQGSLRLKDVLPGNDETKT